MTLKSVAKIITFKMNIVLSKLTWADKLQKHISTYKVILQQILCKCYCSFLLKVYLKFKSFWLLLETKAFF